MKREEKFTPGPWRAGRGPSFDFVTSGRDETLAAWPRSDENAANAALIAAAPDMYELLHNITLDARYFDMDKVEAILKKARGEE